MARQIYSIRIYLDKDADKNVNKAIYRDVEISGHAKLYKLAETIIDAFGFDFDHCFGFFSKLDAMDFYNSLERYELFADMPDDYQEPCGSRSVKRTPISSVFETGKKMTFLFDYGDCWRFIVECRSISDPLPDRKYPYQVGGEGDAPEQYPDHDALYELEQETQESEASTLH